MASIYGIELSEDELDLACEMGLDEFLGDDEELE